MKKSEKIIVGIFGISLGIIFGVITSHLTPGNWMMGPISPVALIILAILCIITFISKTEDKKLQI